MTSFCAKAQSLRRFIVNDTKDLCTCVGPSVGEGEKRPTVCTQCGKRIPWPKQFTDSMLEATYEVLAEEGAIWSGAR
jgi:hypothetical protein